MDNENEEKCPFCLSKTIRLETPYVNALGEKIYSYCCKAQESNRKHLNRRYVHGQEPTFEESTK